MAELVVIVALPCKLFTQPGTLLHLLPLAEAPLRLLVPLRQDLLEGLARACVGGGAAVAPVQGATLGAAATPTVCIPVPAALWGVSVFCRITSP